MENLATSTQSAPAAPNPEPILQIGFGFWASRTLLSAVELGLFTELAKRPANADDLRARLEIGRAHV